MDAFLAMLVSVAAGCHAASYGAYKDSPHESFLGRRYVRELIVAFGVGAVLAILRTHETESYLIIYLSTFTLARISTEVWKLNLRVEPQDHFRIPTQIHLFRHVVHNRALRVLLGMVIPGVVLGVYAISAQLPGSLTLHQKGVIAGLMIGLADASGGAYKDGMFEGFYLRKFAKSATLGPLSGFLISFFTTSPLFHLLGTFGLMRMLIELLFKVSRPRYVPGKFPSMEPVYPEWSKRRRVFLFPYFATWLIFFGLMLAGA